MLKLVQKDEKKLFILEQQDTVIIILQLLEKVLELAINAHKLTAKYWACKNLWTKGGSVQKCPKNKKCKYQSRKRSMRKSRKRRSNRKSIRKSIRKSRKIRSRSRRSSEKSIRKSIRKSRKRRPRGKSIRKSRKRRSREK